MSVVLSSSVDMLVVASFSFVGEASGVTSLGKREAKRDEISFVEEDAAGAGGGRSDVTKEGKHTLNLVFPHVLAAVDAGAKRESWEG